MNKEKIKSIFKTIIQFIFNPRLLLCLGLGWIITNGWSYIMFVLGSYFGIGWMIAVSGSYMAFLWFPFTPEKIITIIIAITLLRLLFPNDTKTLAILKKLHEKAKNALNNRKNISQEERKRKRKKRIIILSSLATIVIVVAVWIGWGNKALMITEITVVDDRIPESFEGFRIAQISDLHNALFGEDNEKLLEMLKQARPDIIVITGDLIDANRTNVHISADFCEKALDLAPVYFVTGNHEAGALNKYKDLKNRLTNMGVQILEENFEIIEKNGEKLCIAGISDPGFLPEFSSELEKLMIETSEFYTVLLSHRPELIHEYKNYGAELVLTGHAHGGQIRVPFIGGLMAPGQGAFPDYDAGLYQEGTTRMIVSRGLGNSRFPFRVNNRPEIVVAVLSAGQ